MPTTSDKGVGMVPRQARNGLTAVSPHAEGPHARRSVSGANCIFIVGIESMLMPGSLIQVLRMAVKLST